VPSSFPLFGGPSRVLLPGARAKGIFNRLFLTGLFDLFRCSAYLFSCVWFCSLTNLGSRAGAPAFFRFAGLVQLLVQCFGRDGLINWSKKLSASDVGLFYTKNITFSLFVRSIVPQICSHMHGFVPLLNFVRFLCSFVPHDLFPSAYFCSLVIFGRFRRSIVPHDLFHFAWFCSFAVSLKSGNKN
jgi:hypothetical protein